MYIYKCVCVFYTGGQYERIQVACNNQHDLQDWLDLLTKHTHTPAAHTHSHKTQSICHTVSLHVFVKNRSPNLSFHPPAQSLNPVLSSSQLPSHPVTPTRHSESRGGSSGHTYHTLPHPSSYGAAHSGSPMWGPLEPPSTPKPWSLSCLRPAPPLRPAAALCYKEVLFNDTLT